MEHIVQEGINSKKNSNPEAFSKTSWKRYQHKKSREILSNKPLRQRCGHGCWLINPLASSFFTFLATGGANWLYKVELNILSLTNFYKPRDVFSTLFKFKKKCIFICKNDILFIHAPRTFLLENGRGSGKPWGRGWILTPCRKIFLFFSHL